MQKFILGLLLLWPLLFLKATPHQFLGASLVNSANPRADLPPSLNIGVGKSQVVILTDNAVKSFDKLTGEPDGILDTDMYSFFGKNLRKNVYPYQPRLIFDKYAKRWYLLAQVADNITFKTEQMFLAVSNDDLITEETVWNIYTLPNPVAPDFAHAAMAVDRHHLYIGSISQLSTYILVIDTDDFLNYTTIGPFQANDPAASIQNIIPVCNFDKNSRFGYAMTCGSNQYQPINLQTSASLPPDFTFDEIGFCRVKYSKEGRPELSNQLRVSVPPFSCPDRAPHRGNLYGDAGKMETGIFTSLQLPHIRNKQLFACHVINVNSRGKGDPYGDRAAIRWYQFDLTGDPKGRGKGKEKENTVPALVQYGTLFDSSKISPKHYYIPSLMTNKKGDMVIIATESGENDFTNVVMGRRNKSDHKGSLDAPIYLTGNKSNPFNFGPLTTTTFNVFTMGQRWGNQSSIALDPDGYDIWSLGQYASHENAWGAQVTQIRGNSEL